MEKKKQSRRQKFQLYVCTDHKIHKNIEATINEMFYLTGEIYKTVQMN